MLHAGVGFWKTAAGPPPAVIQAGAGRITNGTSAEVTLPGVAAGRVLVVASSTYEGGAGDGAPDSITSVPSLTWTQRVISPDVNPDAEFTCASIWTSSVTTAASHAVTANYSGGSYVSFTVLEVSNPDFAALLNASNSTSGTSTTPSSGSATATTSNGIAIACLAVDSSSPALGINAPSGWTNAGLHDTADTALGHSCDYKVISATGAQAAAWGTLSQSERWTGCIVILKAA